MDWLRHLFHRIWRDRGEWTRTTVPPVIDQGPRYVRPPSPRKRSNQDQANAVETCRLYGHSLWHNVCVVCFEHVEAEESQLVMAS